MAKLAPRLTGLPMAVWVTLNEGFAHDVWVRVSRIAGGRGRSIEMAVRPTPRVVVPRSRPARDVAPVSRWIELNRDAIVDYWDGAIEIDEVLARLGRRHSLTKL
jgi:hypothetical protein